MSYENIKHEPMWAIRHIPTGTLLQANPKGYGHTQVAVLGKNSAMWESHMTPRFFRSKRKAEASLRKWLEGYHTFHHEDGIDVSTPTTPRIKEDMEVIEIELITGVKDEQADW